MKRKTVTRLIPRPHWDEAQELPGLIGYLEPLCEYDGDGCIPDGVRGSVEDMVDKMVCRGAIAAWTAAHAIDSPDV